MIPYGFIIHPSVIDSAKRMLDQHKCPMILSEDATGLVRRVTFVPNVGIVGGIDPISHRHVVLKAPYTQERIDKYFEDYTIANYLYIYSIAPIDKYCSPILLTFDLSDNRFSSSDILAQWEGILRQWQANFPQNPIIAQSSDGDGRILALQWLLHFKQRPVMKKRKGSFPDIPFELHCFHVKDDPKDRPRYHLQDPTHLILKNRNAMVKKRMNVCGVRGTLLDAGDILSKQAVSPFDRMNYSLGQEIISKTHDLMKKNAALGLWSRVMQLIDECFFAKELNAIHRLADLLCALFLVRYVRRQWILKRQIELKDAKSRGETAPQRSLFKEFISSNAYISLEVTFASTFDLCATVANDFPSCKIRFDVLGSQACEDRFRSLRAMSPMNSSKLTFDAQLLLQRIRDSNYVSLFEFENPELAPKKFMGANECRVQKATDVSPCRNVDFQTIMIDEARFKLEEILNEGNLPQNSFKDLYYQESWSAPKNTSLFEEHDDDSQEIDDEISVVNDEFDSKQPIIQVEGGKSIYLSSYLRTKTIDYVGKWRQSSDRLQRVKEKKDEKRNLKKQEQ